MHSEDMTIIQAVEYLRGGMNRWIRLEDGYGGTTTVGITGTEPYDTFCLMVTTKGDWSSWDDWVPDASDLLSTKWRKFVPEGVIDNAQ